MFRFTTLPQLASHPIAHPLLARVDSPAAVVSPAARPASAEIRIRRLAESGPQEDSYAAILPNDGGTPIDLLRVITEACKDLPEFQIQNDEDERFILTLTLKS
jgi:hypothetical protein